MTRHDDPSSGATVAQPLPEDALGSLQVSPGGRLLLGQRDHRYVRDPRGEGATGTPPWRRLPDLPSSVSTVGRTTAWAGESLVVWGGASSGLRGEDTVNTAEGWTITPP